jgi:sRNA-binding carbon storage regulator CsrA
VLVISRKENETITIEPFEGVDPAVTLQQVFQHGPIVLTLIRISGSRVRVAIEAPLSFKILRGAGREPAEEGDDAETRVSTAPDIRKHPAA